VQAQFKTLNMGDSMENDKNGTLELTGKTKGVLAAFAQVMKEVEGREPNVTVIGNRAVLDGLKAAARTLAEGQNRLLGKKVRALRAIGAEAPAIERLIDQHQQQIAQFENVTKMAS
jgi:hypothetical protein